jgi:uncharacterized spore protein YtfJ
MGDDSFADGFDSVATFLERFPTVDAETVYGEPVTQGDRTVVPVARVGYRFGAGFGGGESADGDGFGGGGGGTVSARPVGALEVSESGTQFVGVGHSSKRLLVAFALGALLGWLRR